MPFPFSAAVSLMPAIKLFPLWSIANDCELMLTGSGGVGLSDSWVGLVIAGGSEVVLSGRFYNIWFRTRISSKITVASAIGAN